MLNTLEDLAHLWDVEGLADNVTELSRVVARRIYKATANGCPANIEVMGDGTVEFRVFPYVEGFDGDLSHEGQIVQLPAEEERIWEAIKTAEEISAIWWDRTHGCESCWGGKTVCNYWGDEVGPEDWGARPVDKDCKACEGHGVII